MTFCKKCCYTDFLLHYISVSTLQVWLFKWRTGCFFVLKHCIFYGSVRLWLLFYAWNQRIMWWTLRAFPLCNNPLYNTFWYCRSSSLQGLVCHICYDKQMMFTGPVGVQNTLSQSLSPCHWFIDFIEKYSYISIFLVCVKLDNPTAVLCDTQIKYVTKDLPVDFWVKIAVNCKIFLFFF